MPIITDSTNDFRDTIIAALLEINAACWFVRKDQNTGNGSAPGLLCQLPEEVQFQVQFGKDGAINSVTRTVTETPGAISESSSETTPERTRSTSSESTRVEAEGTQVRDDDVGQTQTQVNVIESGGDDTKVKREYEEVP